MAGIGVRGRGNRYSQYEVRFRGDVSGEATAIKSASSICQGVLFNEGENGWRAPYQASKTG